MKHFRWGGACSEISEFEPINTVLRTTSILVFSSFVQLSNSFIACVLIVLSPWCGLQNSGKHKNRIFPSTATWDADVRLRSILPQHQIFNSRVLSSPCRFIKALGQQLVWNCRIHGVFHIGCKIAIGCALLPHWNKTGTKTCWTSTSTLRPHPSPWASAWRMKCTTISVPCSAPALHGAHFWTAMLEDKSRLAGMTLLQVNVHIVKVFKSSLLISPELLQFSKLEDSQKKILLLNTVNGFQNEFCKAT